MLVHGLRLLVALITFAVGVTASWLMGSDHSCGARRGGMTYSREYTVSRAYTFTTRTEMPPPAGSPKRECKTGLSPQVLEGGILNGRARSLPTPVYPVTAKAARVSGSVPVRVLVDVDGSVTSAQAVGGPKLLREAAEDAAREAVFAPTLLSGNPVKVGGVINYNFLPQ
ncbi:MAG: TonB family protein [Pyrinomonadaceae bacterium]